jgi:hypothetical protein
MANKQSASQAAIKDMLACHMNVSMFIGAIKSITTLNEELGINNDRVSHKTATPKYKEEVHKGHHYQVPDIKLQVKVTIRVINPDGTVGLYNDHDWDFK